MLKDKLFFFYLNTFNYFKYLYVVLKNSYFIRKNKSILVKIWQKKWRVKFLKPGFNSPFNQITLQIMT